MNSNASWKSAGDGVSGQFPAGLRVLVVDDDPTCLRILEKMLKNCLYEVTTSNRAELALQFLRDNRNGYDIVISDVHMPDMDGFKLLEHVGLEMDLPVIMMSADDSKNVVMKGVTHGACDYLIKPVRMEALKNIWQHVVRRKKHEWKDKDFEQSGSADEHQRPATEDLDYSSSANEGNWRSSSSSKRRKEEEEDEAEERDDTSTLKKPRVVWSIELHQQFVTAVNQLGIDKAVPKKILELMNVPGLTRENVASHLQKYRLYLRRLSGVPHHQNGLGNSFMGPADSPFGHLASLNGVDLQALAASGQLPPHSLATIQAAALGRATPRPTIPDQRNIFAYETKTPRLVEEQQHQHDNAKFLHGIPTNMDSKKLATLRQNGLGGMSTGQSNSLLINHVGQPVLARRRIDNVSGAQYASIPQSSTTVDFSSRSTDFLGNSYSFVGTSSVTSKLQDEANAETKASRGYVPNYDVFNELNRDRTQEWRCANVGSTIEQPQHSNVRGGLDVSPSVSIQNRFSSNGQNRVPQPVHHSSVSDNPPRIKAESFPDRSFRNTIFPQRFGQDELMSAILKQQEGMGSVENEFGFDGYHLDNLPV